VTYVVTLPADAPAAIRARLCYQSVPPAWAAALESSNSEEGRRFLALYARAGSEPEILAVASSPAEPESR